MGCILGLRHWLEVSTDWPDQVRVCLSSSSESSLYLDGEISANEQTRPERRRLVPSPASSVSKHLTWLPHPYNLR